MRLGRTILVLVAALAGACGAGAWPGGIGAVLRYHRDPSELYIERVPADGAAARAGLAAHDRVLTIDGAPVSNLDEQQVRDRLRGEVGTRVRLHIERDGQERDLEIERAPYR